MGAAPLGRMTAAGGDVVVRRVRQAPRAPERGRATHRVRTGARAIDDAQIAHVSAYYASLPPPASATPAEADAAPLGGGKRLALQGDWDRCIVPCESCRGPDSQGAGPSFPGIAGQHAHYISAQLRAWQEGTRANDPLNLMAAIAKRMTAEDI